MFESLIEDIIRREGKKDTNRESDSGGRTKFGISIKYHPEAWVNGPPTIEDAQRIYFYEYIVGPNIHRIRPEYLMEQVADFGVHSGPSTAIAHLQRILNVLDDGKLGPITLDALSKRDPTVVNNKLVDSRVLMQARLVQKRPRDLENLFGWQRRSLSFRKE